MRLARQVKQYDKVIMYLARLLATDDRQLSRALKILNTTLNGASHDVLVIADIAEKTAALKSALSLDPRDTTSHELYMSLRQRVKDDNERIGRSIGIEHPNAVGEASPRIIAAIRSEFASAQCFVPKTSRIKTMLKHNPPKKVMESLHYRSIDSMLKHEQTNHLVMIARYIEDDAWNERHEAELAMLTASDFESRNIEIFWLDKAVLVDAFAKTNVQHHLVIHAKEVGCVAIAPTTEKVINSYTIRTVSLLVHYIQELLYFSSYAKVVMTDQAFGKQYARAIVGEHDSHFQLAQYPLHWRSMHYAVHEGKFSDVFPPHVSSDDWHTKRANDTLHAINDVVDFWRDYSYVIGGEEDYVSANVIDVAIDDSLNAVFGSHSLKYAQRDLQQELLSRYLQEPRVHTVVLKRFGVV